MIDVNQLERSFGSTRILRDISFQIPPGETVALLGGNGAGKTTLMRILATLLTPSGGDVKIGGFSVLSDPKSVRSKIGWMPAQDRGFFPRLNGLDNLLYFGAMRRMTKNQTLELLAVFEEIRPLSQALKTRFQLCSSGMRQSLAFVRAFLGDPPVILLDEPTRSLDDSTKAAFWDLLKSRFSNKSILFSTPLEEKSEQITCRKILIRNGVATQL